MKILIVSTFFPPLNSVASLRPYSWAKYWTLAGHEVTVLTIPKQQDPSLSLDLPNPGFELLEIPLPHFISRLKANYHSPSSASSSPSWKKRLFDFLNRIRHRTGIFNSCRMPDFTDLWIRPALKAIRLKQEKWELVVSTSGPYSVHVIAEQIKKNGWATKWIADYRDPWSDHYFYPGLFPFNLIEKKWEKRLMRSADAIVAVSAPLAEVMATKHGPEKVQVVENGFDQRDIERLAPQSIFLGNEKFRIVHTGTFYSGKCDPTPLFEAIHALKDDPFLNRLEVLFVGFKLDDLKKWIAHYQVEPWVKVQGVVSREEALRMQRDAHALLFLPLNEMPVDGILTGKLFEYLFSGTPILAVGGKDMEASQKLMLEAKCGVVLPDAEKIVAFLKPRLKSLAKEKTFPDVEFLKKFERKFQALKLLETFSETPKTPSCAVIIVTHNSQLHIHKAMECLKQQTRQPDYIVIVDSGSKETDYLLRYQNPTTTVVLAGNDIGFCKGNNIGVSHIPSTCDYVFFLNPDAFLTPHFLEGAVKFMEQPQNQQYSALTGTVLGYDIVKDMPTGRYDSTGVFRKWYGKWYDRGQGLKYDPAVFQVKEDIPAICGAVLFGRKKALDSVLIRGSEVLDHTFFMYKEDIDLALRLRKRGWKLAFEPNLIAYHCRGWTRDRSKMPRSLRLLSAYNELRIHAKNSSPIGTCYSFIKYAAVKLFDI